MENHHYYVTGWKNVFFAKNSMWSSAMVIIPTSPLLLFIRTGVKDFWKISCPIEFSQRSLYIANIFSQKCFSTSFFSLQIFFSTSFFSTSFFLYKFFSSKSFFLYKFFSLQVFFLYEFFSLRVFFSTSFFALQVFFSTRGKSFFWNKESALYNFPSVNLHQLKPPVTYIFLFRS